eukprot:s389_g6.t2
MNFAYFTAGLGGSGAVNLLITNLGFGDPVPVFRGGAYAPQRVAGAEPRRVEFFLDESDPAFEFVGERDVWSWPFPEAGTVPRLVGITGNSSTGMGTAPGIWTLDDGWFSEGLAWFSLPMVWFTDQFVKETHAMRVEVTTSDGRRCVAVQTHESFRRCVAQLIQTKVLVGGQTSTSSSGLSWRPGVFLPETLAEDEATRSDLFQRLSQTEGTVSCGVRDSKVKGCREVLAWRGADAKKVMKIQGEDVSPLQWAQKYGDSMTADRLRKAISRAAEDSFREPPLIILPDVDARVESTTKKLPVAILFPGQGSQYVKMLAEVLASSALNQTDESMGRGICSDDRMLEFLPGGSPESPTMPLPLSAAAVTDSMGEVPQSKLQEFAWRHQKLHDQIRLISQVSETLLQDMILAQDEPFTLSPKGGRSRQPSSGRIDSFESAPAGGHATGHTPILSAKHFFEQRSLSQASIPSVERIQSDFLQSQMSWAGAQGSMKRKQSQSSKSLNAVQDPGSHSAHLLDLDAAADMSKREQVDDDVSHSIANVVDSSARNESPGAVLSKRKEASVAPVVVMSSLVPGAPSPPVPPPPVQSLVAPAPSQDLPGVLEAPDEQNGSLSPDFRADDDAPIRNVSFVNIASMAQTTILDNWNSSRPKQRSTSDVGEEDKRFNGDCWDSWDVGSRVLLKFPLFLYAVLVLFTLAEVGMVLYLKYEGHARTTSRANTLACAVIYLLASSSSGVLLSTAIRSEEFRLALGNLSSFLADFELDFSHAAGLAWRKYFSLWLGFVVLVVFTQVWEMQRTFTDLDPAARESTEVQIIILVVCDACMHLRSEVWAPSMGHESF